MKPATGCFKRKFLVVIKPSISISTAMAYSQVKPEIPETSITEILEMPKEQWRYF